MTISQTLDAGEFAALRDELLVANTLQLRLLERIDDRLGRAALAEVLEMEKANADAEVTPLQIWDGIPERTFGVQSSQHHRVHRVLDYLLPGDRVLDIGPSYGYLTGCLLRDASLGSYTGIDISDRALTAIRAMAAVNGLSDGITHLEQRSVFDVDAAFVDEHSPDIITVLEVLEHLTDPELAIATIARAMNDDQAVLFSVPLLGRLEHVWGHLSLFDSTRLMSMCRRAALHVQHIEPVHNVWTLVLATRSPAPPARLAQVAQRSAHVPDASTTVPRGAFKRLNLGKATASGGRGVEVTALPEGGVRCRMSGDGTAGGVLVPVQHPYRLRLELSFPEPDGVKAVEIEGLDAEGARTLRWTWRVDPARAPLPTKPATFVLGHRRSYRTFKHGAEERPAATVAFRVGLTTERGRAGSVVLHKAAALRA